MKAKTLARIGLSLVAFALLGLAWREAARERQLRHAIGQREGELRTLNEQLHAAQSRAASAERESAARAEAAVAAASKPAPIESPSSAAKLAAPVRRDPKAVTAQDPKLRALYLESFKDVTNYGAKFRAVHLTPAQIEAWVAVYAERNAAELELAATAEAQGLTQDDPVLKKMAAAFQKEWIANLRAALGESAFKEWGVQWEVVNRANALYGLADSIARKTYLSDAPLTFERGEQLIQILAEHTERSNGYDLFTAAVNADRIDWDAVMRKVNQAGFPAAQVAAISKLEQASRASRAMQQMIDATAKRFPAAKPAELKLPTPALPRRKS